MDLKQVPEVPEVLVGCYLEDRMSRIRTRNRMAMAMAGVEVEVVRAVYRIRLGLTGSWGYCITI